MYCKERYRDRSGDENLLHKIFGTGARISAYLGAMGKIDSKTITSTIGKGLTDFYEPGCAKEKVNTKVEELPSGHLERNSA